MTTKEITNFYVFLENLSTYNNFYIEIPNEIKMTKSTYDFRSEMQKMGGYKERYK